MHPVAKAVEKVSTYVWASEALALLAPAYGGIDAANRVLLREAKARRIPWTHTDVDPPGTPVDELWQQSSLKAQLAQNEATFTEMYVLEAPLRPAAERWFGMAGDAFGGNTITVSGIKFERAAVEALLPAGYVPPLPLKSRDWFNWARVQYPRNGRTVEPWAAEILAAWKRAHKAGQVESPWAGATIERELESPRK